MPHVARNDVAGVRPGRVLVRIVVGPHAVVAAPPGEQPPADMVIEESRVDLSLEIFAGRFIDGKLFGMAMALEGFVALP